MYICHCGLLSLCVLSIGDASAASTLSEEVVDEPVCGYERS